MSVRAISSNYVQKIRRILGLPLILLFKTIFITGPVDQRFHLNHELLFFRELPNRENGTVSKFISQLTPGG